MTSSLATFLKPGPTAPRAVLLPDGLFFTRALPVIAGASPADVASQVELALETLSPFPPTQLYHGYYHLPGADRVLVFAAYRRRFTSEQTAEWENAELVIPTFAALLGADIKPGTTVILPSDAGVTALYFDHSPVPGRVVFRPVPADAPETDRTRTIEELARAVPTHRIVTLAAAPVADPSGSERDYVFTSDALQSTLPLGTAAAMDVRDKGDLAALRRARSRDVALWRIFLGTLMLLLLLALGELALIGGRVWLKSLNARASAQRPVVEKIMTAQNLTSRTNELSTKRLLPFEMISIISEKKPDSVTFALTSTSKLNELTVQAYTNSPPAVSAYQAALTALPQVQRVEVRDQRSRENVMTFTLVITFRAEALKPVSPGA